MIIFFVLILVYFVVFLFVFVNFIWCLYIVWWNNIVYKIVNMISSYNKFGIFIKLLFVSCINVLGKLFIFLYLEVFVFFEMMRVIFLYKNIVLSVMTSGFIFVIFIMSLFKVFVK